jgi:hypothetical protein
VPQIKIKKRIAPKPGTPRPPGFKSNKITLMLEEVVSMQIESARPGFVKGIDLLL